ncbi:MAG: sortase [Clostridia bacterium]|nr:sortase [Clostridia bacterium]
MSIKKRHAAIGLILFLLIIINSFVVIGFFTKDEYNEITYSKASSNDYDTIVSTKIDEQKIPESYVFEDKKASENTNENKSNIENDSKKVEKTIVNEVSSRSSSSRKTAESAKKETPKETVTNTEVQTQKPAEKPATAEKAQSSIPAGEVSIGTIVIPKTGVNLPILQKVSSAGMEVASCFLYSTGSINVSGTTIIVGHNYSNGKLFSNNKNLGVGDSIKITANGITKSYTVYETMITTSDDLSYLDRNTTNEPQIALSTCTNNGQKRLVILAK